LPLAGSLVARNFFGDNKLPLRDKSEINAVFHVFDRSKSFSAQKIRQILSRKISDMRRSGVEVFVQVEESDNDRFNAGEFTGRDE